jgi:Fe-S-cluster-containing hydrogenase component 2
VGCQIGPLVCPKEAVTHVEGEIANGRLAERPSVDTDPDTCVLCEMCEVMCPKNAITLTINGERENPVPKHGAFPDLIQSTVFDRDAFDWGRKDFVIDNCPTSVISYDEADELPVWVKRWRVRHEPVESAAWIDALTKLADDKVGSVECARGCSGDSGA